jgi:hypothetical protein
MTCIIDTKSRRHLATKLAAGLAISVFLVLGTFVASADAQPRGDQHRVQRRDEHRDRGREYRGPGYYPAPPVVVYGAPYYAPPPVVYGPGIGVYIGIP